MSWVTIDYINCNECGICALSCARCFTKKESGIEVYADEDNCNLCGHCVSLCPTGAIVQDKMAMDNFLEIDREINFDPDDFIEFLRRRRSHRSFKKRQIPREKLEKLTNLCRYAPTGSNRQSVEILIIQDPVKIKRLSELTVDYFKDMLDKMEKQVKQIQSDEKKIYEGLQTAYAALRPKIRMVAARDMGLDPIFYGAPALMIFHSAPQPSTPKDDCVIAAHTVVMAAMTMGLESCYIGLFVTSAANYPPVAEVLNLPEGNQVLSSLILGYSRLKFLRTVDRKPIKVRWE